jgi:predicted ABC-type ATPase
MSLATETSRYSVPRRLRMFAGPNGSGKTSLVRSLSKEFSPDGLFQLHYFLNADDLLSQIQSGIGVSLQMLRRIPSVADIRAALLHGNRLDRAHPILSTLRIKDDQLYAAPESADGYVGAAIADFLREQLLACQISFSFETVMSHPSKVDFFGQARTSGYRTYLYFVATDSPNLNVLRIQNRVAQGEHDVPKDKIVDRYDRCLRLLPKAIAEAHRAYVFDNSGDEPIWLAEWRPDGSAHLKLPDTTLPEWFKTWVVPFCPELISH